MRTTTPIALLLMVTAGLSLSGCSIFDPNPEAVVSGELTDTPREKTGKTLYEDNCISCHGADGTPLAATITSLKGWTDLPKGTYGKFDTTLTTGPGGMPRFDTLDTEERTMIYEYLKTLK